MSRGFPGGASGKEPACQCRRHKRCRFNPWARKIPWRRSWQPTPVLLPGRSHGQRSLEEYSPWGRKRVGQDWNALAHVHKCQITTIWVRKFCIVIKNFLYLPLFHLKWNCIHFPMLQNIRELTFFSWSHYVLGSSSVTIQSYLIPTTFSEVVKSLQPFCKIKNWSLE